MLAKMAHSFAVARRGLDTFHPALTDLIQEKTSDFSDVVGCHPYRVPRVPQRVRMQLVDIAIGPKPYIVVNVQIFANLGAPVFNVVIGERKNI